MPQGTVKFFNARKTVYFTRGSADVFVHYSNIEALATALEEGQTVEFEIGEGRKGDEAQNVRVV